MPDKHSDSSLLLKLARDHEGFLMFPEEWTTDIAMQLAIEGQQEFTEQHWEIIHYIREYYEINQRYQKQERCLNT